MVSSASSGHMSSMYGGVASVGVALSLESEESHPAHVADITNKIINEEYLTIHPRQFFALNYMLMHTLKHWHSEDGTDKYLSTSATDTFSKTFQIRFQLHGGVGA